MTLAVLKGTDFPLVTVVTPSFNQGRFIKETIESVLTQDYPNVEYIVVDGGSTDETVEILKSYGDRIRWVSEKDNGQADAVNKGIRMARGQIIGWLNSDDIYLPGAIHEAVRILSGNACLGMVYGEGYHVAESGEIIERYPTEPFNYKRLAEVCFVCQPTGFLRRDALMQVGLLREDLHLCLDYELWMRIGKQYQIAYTPKYMATSRLYDSNKTLSRKNEVYFEAINAVKMHFGYVPLTWIFGDIDLKRNGARGFFFYTEVIANLIKWNWTHPLYVCMELARKAINKMQKR